MPSRLSRRSWSWCRARFRTMALGADKQLREPVAAGSCPGRVQRTTVRATRGPLRRTNRWAGCDRKSWARIVQIALKIIRRGLLLLTFFLGTLFSLCTLWALLCGPILITADVHDHGWTENERMLPDLVEVWFRGAHVGVAFKKIAELPTLVAEFRVRGTFDDPPPNGIPDFLEWGARWGLASHYDSSREWFVTSHFAVPTAVLALCWMPLLRNAIRQRRRHRTGYCRNCGYNLTGNVSGRCPECGFITAARLTGNS